MAREYTGFSKPNQLESKRKRLIHILVVSVLCVFFYLLGAWQRSSPAPSTQSEIYNRVGCGDSSTSSSLSSSYSMSSGNLDFESHHQLTMNVTDDSQRFPACDLSMVEYVPCHGNRGKRYFKDRHCPKKNDLLRCLVPAPPKYRTPFRWPESRDYVWYNNIPHKELSVQKAIQNWIVVEGDRFRFPGGGTMFPNGADAYIDDIAKLIPLSRGNIRTAIDTGCGVASWGAYLLGRDIVTMSFAPRDVHESQVWFALERGVPAMIGIMSSNRLPYPARAFDMAHCSRCLIPWNKTEGLYLMEVDRVLRPGGYWVLSGPPIHWKRYWKGWERSKEDLEMEQTSIEDIAERLCWTKVVEKDDLAVWQKPLNHRECIESSKTSTKRLICKSGNPDAAWYNKLEKCMTPLPEVSRSDEVAGGALEKWPVRAFAVPPRISSGSVPDVSLEKYQEDNDAWKDRLANYERIVSPLQRGLYRNIMDMNAYLGGFSAALLKHPVWVMNVVPANVSPDTLGAIYERGFIGTYHDWCESFSTYPRTYDLIHAGNVFSLYQDRCDITYILLELDRILRPRGTVIFRDTVDVLLKIKGIADRMRWTSLVVDHEEGPFNPEKILISVKDYWTGEFKQG